MAIKVEELRSRNWIKSVNDGEAFSLPTSELIYIADNPEGYDPIPLTEEWIFKFGFDISKAYDGVARYTKGVFNFYGVCEYENGIEVEAYGVKFAEIDIAIKTVHQLQNLTYALTGQELTA